MVWINTGYKPQLKHISARAKLSNNYCNPIAYI